MPGTESILAKKQKLGIDADMLAKLSDPVFANGIDRHFCITRKKVIALKLMLFSFNTTDNRPSAEEKCIVEEFLANIRGDVEVNKELKQIAILGLAGNGRGAALIAKLMTYIYKTRHYKTFVDAFKKLIKNHLQMQGELVLEEADRLSLREYSNIYDIAHIKPLLVEFEKKGFLNTNSEFVEFCQQAKRATDIIMKIEGKFREPYPQAANATAAATQQAGG